VSDRLVSIDLLIDFCAGVFERLGLSGNDARLTAVMLVAANARGVDSHGVVRLRIYADRLRSGGIKPHGEPSVISDGPAFALLDGCGGVGQLIALRAMELAVEKARATTVAVVAVRNSNHCGALAPYGLIAAEGGMIGLATTNASPTMSPWGGARRLLGTNPLCVAVPAGRERPIVLDMATSSVSLGKIIVAAMSGEEIPTTWGFDREWQATSNPEAVTKGGSLQPVGGYKGSGLSMILDVLSGVLAGGEFSSGIRNLYANASESQEVSHLFAALRVESFLPLAEFRERIDRYVALFHQCPAAPGVERVYVPGEIEDEVERERRKNGIPLGEGLIAELAELATQLGLAPLLRDD
jgi:LDH2 family malate/lactate/ureidoglycolate dehydrogenase